AVLRELQAGVSAALGLPDAIAAVWNDEDGALETLRNPKLSDAEILALAPGVRLHNGMVQAPPDAMLVGRCFTSQQPLYSEHAAPDDPERAALYAAVGAQAMLLAPISLGGDRFGVLGVFSPRPRLFADDSLGRLQLMAHYAAVMLRSRKLLE